MSLVKKAGAAATPWIPLILAVAALVTAIATAALAIHAYTAAP